MAQASAFNYDKTTLNQMAKQIAKDNKGKLTDWQIQVADAGTSLVVVLQLKDGESKSIFMAL